MDYNKMTFISMPMGRIRITVSGIVQGVGFRPFIYRCAKESGLAGFIKNTAGNVLIEVQGSGDRLDDFVKSMLTKHPPLVSIRDFKAHEIPVAEDTDFVIVDSASSCQKEPLVPPDFSICDDCLMELFDSSDRRYRYPFINCTNCGPRFTIIKGLPYDRPLTSMASFEMCPECLQEYKNPLDRRFHAEPNACPVCGPKVFWAERGGSVVAEGDDAFRLCEDAIRSGQIAAVTGIGGFHLMAGASNDDAIRLLRERKARHERPFAVIFPADKHVPECLYRGKDMLSHLRGEAFIDTEEEKAILSKERPIVVLRRKTDSKLSKLISPGLDTVGAFLPYSPLHCLLLEDLKMPLIATSANFSDSPIIKDNQEAMDKLNGIADGFLLHNRDIIRRCDDSVMAVSKRKTIFIRRSRGYTPHVFKLPYKLNEPVLAVGGNQKNTIALGWEDKAVMSQHLGDLTTEEGIQAFEQAAQDLTDFYNIKPLRIACDMHPDYLSAKWAASRENVQVVQVQHHHAHIAACMLDNNLTDKVLGISWDGSGYGSDGAIWGGEFLIADYKGFERFCTFRKFRLLGGEQAVKEPRRVLLSILYEIYGEDILRSQKPEARS
ncbi:MAG: carbamoyltransferase HypF, partial [Deltaproteobacteria bacterium]|nr:carbamoyltransferase HypF [Deltaproteobacteria bacterium]